MTIREHVGSRRDPVDALAAAASRGDARAFEDLVVATTPSIYALALRLLGNEHDAADAVQETYLRAYRSIGRFRGESSVTTWLYRIAANRCATLRKRRDDRSTSELEESFQPLELHSDRLPSDAADSSDERRAIAAALRRLPYTLRSVVVLHDVYDLAHDAIARELDITVATSKVRLHRGRRRLRELLYPVSHPHVATPSALGAVHILSPRKERRVVGL